MRRFSIRDLLWLTLVVGLALGWWADRQRIVGEMEIARREVAQLKWSAYSWKSTAVGLAKDVRAKGWFVKIMQDGSGYGWTHPDNLVNPKVAEELNRVNPLPIP